MDSNSSVSVLEFSHDGLLGGEIASCDVELAESLDVLYFAFYGSIERGNRKWGKEDVPLQDLSQSTKSLWLFWKASFFWLSVRLFGIFERKLGL